MDTNLRFQVIMTLLQYRSDAETNELIHAAEKIIAFIENREPSVAQSR